MFKIMGVCVFIHLNLRFGIFEEFANWTTMRKVRQESKASQQHMFCMAALSSAVKDEWVTQEGEGRGDNVFCTHLLAKHTYWTSICGLFQTRLIRTDSPLSSFPNISLLYCWTEEFFCLFVFASCASLWVSRGGEEPMFQITTEYVDDQLIWIDVYTEVQLYEHTQRASLLTTVHFKLVYILQNHSLQALLIIPICR